MNNRQRTVLFLLHQDARRDLYEGAAEDGKSGSGLYFISFSEGKKYQPLTTEEVERLVKSRHIVKKYKWCYTLARTVEMKVKNE